MYIRTVTISGFKSYKDSTFVEPFSPKTNCIVGSNGSGKSNLFFALRFVLGEHSGLSAEERQRLLHEGTGLAVMSAFVEVVFDNSDSRRLPIERDQVTIRRSIGLKKDEFFLDRKHVTKSDITNLLESAGFTQSNPYYIVQQGKVNELVVMKDEQRLQLLKEVAGTRVYEARRQESLKIMHDTDGRREKINEVLKYIAERLSELEEEKEELKEYQKIDRERRVLEYTIYDRELQEAREKLEEVDQKRIYQSEHANELHSRAQQVAVESEEVERELQEVQNALVSVRKKRKAMDIEREDGIRKRTQLELELRDVGERAEQEKDRHATLEKEAASLKKQIETAEKQLQKAEKAFFDQRQQESTMKTSIQDKQRELSALYGKQGRSKQFQSTKERDAWIRGEMEQYSSSIREKERRVVQVKKEATEAQKKVQTLETQVRAYRTELEAKRVELEQVVMKHGDLKAERDQVANQRLEQRRREQELHSKVESCRTDLLKTERKLDTTRSKAITMGLNAVRRIMNQHSIRGIHGPVIELFTCDEKFMTAVEVTAGNSLFHVVVDSDEVASQVLHHLNRERAGRVTFMPLNRLKPSRKEVPDTEDALPMFDQLKFNPMYEKVFLQIFGKTLVCRNMDVAQTQSRLRDLDCITLEGDQMNRRGAVTGGFYDKRKSRLDSQRKIFVLKDQLKKLTVEYEQGKKSLQVADQKVTHTVSEMQKCETARLQLSEAYNQLQMNLRSSMNQQKSLHMAMKSKETSVEHLEADIKQMREVSAQLEKELGTDTLGNLTRPEQQRLVQLNEEISELKKRLPALSSKRAEIESSKTDLETLLDDNLRRRAIEVEEELTSVAPIGISGNQAALESQVKLLSETLKLTEERQRECEEEVDQLSKQRRALDARMEELRSENNQLQQDVLNESKQMERVINRRMLLVQKKDSSMAKIRDLGSLPANAFEKHRKTSVKVLMRSLHQAHEALKKYSHVNKKAMDQYVSFTEQQQELEARKAELDADANAIRGLINDLDQRKDEAIQRTFRDVTRHFKAVFSELVPDGKGTLVMKRSGLEEEEEDEEEEEGKKQVEEGVLEYTGVGISVEFGGAVKAQNMQQLSGGQKAVVALALIFAIQRIDPAPFYLFDEIDSALDSEHRAAVARCIRNQANLPDGGAQFIMTTFRPELVDIADKVYAVTFRNRVSSVSVLDKASAIEFVNADISHRV